MDIKISLEIGLSPALENFLGRFLNVPAKPAPATAQVDRDTASHVEPEAVITGDLTQEAPQEDAPKPRGRRKAADVKTDASPATPASGDPSPASAATTVNLLGGDAGPTATTDASHSDALSLMLGETEAAADTEPTVTKDDVAAALRACMDKGVAMPTLQAVFVEKGHGAKSIGQVAPEHYAAVHAEFQKLAA